MILLFGQIPQFASITGQFVIHSLVGSIGDTITPPILPTRLSSGGGYYYPTYVKRDKISSKPIIFDNDVTAALAAFFVIETDQ